MQHTRERLFIDDSDHVERARDAIVSGKVIAHAFGNFYVMSAKPDAEIVRRVNLMKGRPPDQVGSVLTTRPHVRHLFDWSQLPSGITEDRVMDLVDDCFGRGPIGFRGPAAAHMPEHLTFPDHGVRTTQLIAPGYRCACNQLLDDAMNCLPDRYLYVTSANRSRHQTGADDEPAHFEGDGLEAEFGHEIDFRLIRHRSEDLARAAYPGYAPMSTTILAFHRLATPTGGSRPVLLVDRHGSLPVEDLRILVNRHGFDLTPGPKATHRLAQRDPIQPVTTGAIQ